MSTIEMKRMNETHCVLLQCCTQILCTFSSDSITSDGELRECLDKMHMMTMKEMKWTHCVLLQCCTQILCTFSSDSIASDAELGECLDKIQKMSVTEVNGTVRSQDPSVRSHVCRVFFSATFMI